MNSGKYSRVYVSIIDDEKFASVYDDDAALALWLRLLLIADQAWPSSAHLPARHGRRALKTLLDAKLVELVSGGRYRIHGLDAERDRRATAAKIGAKARWTDSSANENRLDSERTPNGSETEMPRRDEQRRHETTRTEQSKRSAVTPLSGTMNVTRWLTEQGVKLDIRSTTWLALQELIAQHGGEAVLAAMKRLPSGLHDAPQYVFGARKHLNPIPRFKAGPAAKGLGPSFEEVERAFEQ